MVDILRHRGRGTGVTPGLYHGRDKVMHRKLGATEIVYMGIEPGTVALPTAVRAISWSERYSSNDQISLGDTTIFGSSGTVTEFGAMLDNPSGAATRQMRMALVETDNVPSFYTPVNIVYQENLPVIPPSYDSTTSGPVVLTLTTPQVLDPLKRYGVAIMSATSATCNVYNVAASESGGTSRDTRAGSDGVFIDPWSEVTRAGIHVYIWGKVTE